MYILLVLLHLTVCFFLILIVLLQSGKGAEIGAAFGGSSQTLFGSRGTATLLNKLTTASAVVFMITSLSLAIISSRTGGSVIRQTPVTSIPSQRPAIPQQQGPIQGQPLQQSPVKGQVPAPQPQQQPRQAPASKPAK